MKREEQAGNSGVRSMAVSPEIIEASILVVDDLEADVRLVESMLGGAGYSRVTSTRDPREVCALHRKNRYDLIILDLLMPEMDGFQVMDCLQTVEPGYLPVLAVTADPDLMSRALEAGARDYINKPLRASELLARVHNLVEVGLLMKERRNQALALEQTLQDRTARLWESTEIFRRFAAHVPEGLMIRGVDDRIVRYVNPSWHRITGLPLAVGDSTEQAVQVVHLEDRERVRAEMARYPLGGFDLQFRLASPGPEPRWAHGRSFPIADADGQPHWVAAILEDVTARKNMEEQARLHAARLEAEIAERRQTEQALRETESRFRALVEQSIVGIYVVDEGRLTYANPRLCTMLGYTEEELRGMQNIELIVEEDRERLIENRRRRDAGDMSSLIATYRMRRRDGRILHLAVDGRVIEQQGRKVLFGIGQDVTERVRAQELLVEAESHYRALVEQSIVGIYIIGGEHILYANPRLCEITGYSAAKLAALTTREIVIEEDHGMIDSVLRRRRAGELGSIADNCRVRRPDGRIVHLSIESKIIELAGRKAAIGVVQDITERALAAQALRESEEKYRLLWETTSDAVILMGEDMEILYANPSVKDVFGYEPQEVEGRPIALLQPERLREAHARGMRRYLRTGVKRLEWRSTEIVGLHKDGHEFPVEIAFSHMNIGHKSIFAGFMRDITARKQAQAALEYANERLGILSKRVLAIQEEERRSISRELHDDVGQSLLALRMGLHRIVSHVGEREAEVLAHCIGVSDAIQEKLRELSVQLLPPQLEQLGLPDALRWLASRQRSLSGLAIGCRFGVTGRFPLEVEVACYRICQEAVNNATRHARASSIVVELDSDGESLILTIRDNGAGFDLRSKREESLRSGSLGLISMEERARLAGGRLEVHSTTGKGTFVCAFFPLSTPADEPALSNGASASA
jgi:PAS domain S-box-containing protein